MLILAIESSAKAASVALGLDGSLYAQYFQNNGQTHSKSIMPMIRDMLSCANVRVDDLDAVAVAVGPGSFTGLRIGIAAAKGIAWAKDKPCVAVSTLEAMANQAKLFDGIICCAMDARRNQVYNALFEAAHGEIKRLTQDRAIALEELAEEVKNFDKKIIVIGDGAQLCYNYLNGFDLEVVIASENIRMQSAAGVLAVADRLYREGQTVSCEELSPNYLRLSQAERERLERIKSEE